jgi:DNA primase
LTNDRWQKKAYHYVRSRNVTDHQIKDKRIGYSMVGDMAYRVVFPVYVKGKLEGLVGRDFTGKQEPKYRNSVGGKALYNYQDRQHRTVCLMEGVFDTLAAEKPANKLDMDVNGLLGHDLTDDQLELLEGYRTIILWLDPDAAGLKGLQSIPKKIPKDKIVKAVLPLAFKHKGATDADPSELESSVIVKRLLHAKPLTPELQLSLRAWSAFDE